MCWSKFLQNSIVATFCRPTELKQFSNATIFSADRTYAEDYWQASDGKKIVEIGQGEWQAQMWFHLSNQEKRPKTFWRLE